MIPEEEIRWCVVVALLLLHLFSNVIPAQAFAEDTKPVLRSLAPPSTFVSVDTAKCYTRPPTLSEICLGYEGCDQSISANELTKTTEEAPEGVAFMTLGDWGESGSKRDSVIKQMTINAERFKVQYALALGDNFYDDGVMSVEDPKWAAFEKLFSHRVFQQMPFYGVLGNHDYHFSPFSQVMYSLYPTSRRWYMPNPWYYTVRKYTNVPKKLAGKNPYKKLENISDAKTPHTTDFPSEDEDSPDEGSEDEKTGKKMTVVTIFIDTQILSKTEVTDFRLDYDNLYDKQMRFLKQALRAGAEVADWLFVVGHYELFSSGQHGDIESLKTSLLPLFKEHKVDAYFNGHEHFLELLYDEDSGTHFFTSGSASKTRDVKCIHEHCLFAADKYGFTSHVLTRNRLYSAFINKNGKVLKRYTQKVRKQKTISGADETSKGMFPPLEFVSPGLISDGCGLRWLKSLQLFVAGMLFGLLLTSCAIRFDLVGAARRRVRYMPLGFGSGSQLDELPAPRGRNLPGRSPTLPQRIWGKLSPYGGSGTST